MGLLKKAFNRGLLTVGATPVIFTTSPVLAKLTKTSPLFDKKWTVNEYVHYEAESLGYSNPEERSWKVSLVTQGEKIIVDDMSPVTFTRMAEFMRERELEISRAAGLTGTDKEIARKSVDYVKATNILKYTDPVLHPLKPPASHPQSFLYNRVGGGGPKV